MYSRPSRAGSRPGTATRHRRSFIWGNPEEHEEELRKKEIQRQMLEEQLAEQHRQKAQKEAEEERRRQEDDKVLQHLQYVKHEEAKRKLERKKRHSSSLSPGNLPRSPSVRNPSPRSHMSNSEVFPPPAPTVKQLDPSPQHSSPQQHSISRHISSPSSSHEHVQETNPIETSIQSIEAEKVALYRDRVEFDRSCIEAQRKLNAREQELMKQEQELMKFHTTLVKREQQLIEREYRLTVKERDLNGTSAPNSRPEMPRTDSPRGMRESPESSRRDEIVNSSLPSKSAFIMHADEQRGNLLQSSMDKVSMAEIAHLEQMGPSDDVASASSGEIVEEIMEQSVLYDKKDEVALASKGYYDIDQWERQERQERQAEGGQDVGILALNNNERQVGASKLQTSRQKRFQVKELTPAERRAMEKLKSGA